MKKFTLIALLLSLLVSGCASCAQAEQTVFFSALQDVPLMPGLAELSEQTVIFDKPGGRIIESVADMGRLSRDEVLSYYAGSLPQFGWIPEGRGRFVRDSEALEIGFQRINGHEFLRIGIMPLQAEK